MGCRIYPRSLDTRLQTTKTLFVYNGIKIYSFVKYVYVLFPRRIVMYMHENYVQEKGIGSILFLSNGNKK